MEKILKTKKDYVVRKIMNKNILMSKGENSDNSIIELSDSGLLIWIELEKGITYNELIEKNKSAFLETINTKIAELLKIASSGTESGLLTDEEIWKFIDSKLNSKKQTKKVRTHKNGRK